MQEKQMQMKQAVEQLIQKGNFDIVDQMFSLDYKVHSGDKTYTGHAFIIQYAKQIRNAMPDVTVLKVEFLTQTDDVITWQRIFKGTHQKNLKGIPASNKKVKWYEIVVTRFENGKIKEEWIVSDLAFQLMRNLKNK